MDDAIKGLIFDIQGHSVHDGPGCRTLVFLSGCPLRCAWCANPEGQLFRPRVMFRERKCVAACQRCVSACPRGAIHRDLTGLSDLSGLRFDRDLCDRCDTLDCVGACLYEALKTAGRATTVGELMRVLRRDQDYWGSGGGVTFTGGEPLAQPEFLLGSLKECRASYIHTGVETCAHVNTDLLQEVLRWTDWLFIDLKHMDSAAHRAGTGAGNELILRNVAMVATAGWPGRLIIRVPVVPGYNDTPENLQATAAFVARLGLKEVSLLPFHRLGASKYEQLGLPYPYAHMAALSEEALQAHQRIFMAAGLQCYVGSETPF